MGRFRQGGWRFARVALAVAAFVPFLHGQAAADLARDTGPVADTITLPFRVGEAGGPFRASLRLPRFSGTTPGFAGTMPSLMGPAEMGEVAGPWPARRGPGGSGPGRLTLKRSLLPRDGLLSLDLVYQARLEATPGFGPDGSNARHTLRLDASVPLTDDLSFDVSVGRRLRLARGPRDGAENWVLSAGMTATLGEGWEAGVQVTLEDRLPRTNLRAAEVSVSLDRDLGDDVTAGLVAYRGLGSDGATGIGVRVAYRLDARPGNIRR